MAVASLELHLLGDARMPARTVAIQAEVTLANLQNVMQEGLSEITNLYWKLSIILTESRK
jgi:hypothetical protein